MWQTMVGRHGTSSLSHHKKPINTCNVSTNCPMPSVNHSLVLITAQSHPIMSSHVHVTAQSPPCHIIIYPCYFLVIALSCHHLSTSLPSHYLATSSFSSATTCHPSSFLHFLIKTSNSHNFFIKHQTSVK